MSNLELTDISQFRDTMATWLYHNEVEEFGVEPALALKHAAEFTRDQGRTPLQWSNSPNGGFCPQGVQPWLPVNPDYARGVNVADQVGDSESLLHFYRRFLHLRRSTPALIEGDYLPLDAGSEDCLAFLRRAEKQTCLVILNFSGKPYSLDFTGADALSRYQTAKTLYPEHRTLTDKRFDLPPWGILVTEVG
jgi:glycosidase